MAKTRKRSPGAVTVDVVAMPGEVRLSITSAIRKGPAGAPSPLTVKQARSVAIALLNAADEAEG